MVLEERCKCSEGLDSGDIRCFGASEVHQHRPRVVSRVLQVTCAHLAAVCLSILEKVSPNSLITSPSESHHSESAELLSLAENCSLRCGAGQFTLHHQWTHRKLTVPEKHEGLGSLQMKARMRICPEILRVPAGGTRPFL